MERRARRPPYWSAARTRDGAALVGTSGNYVLECAYDVEAGARGESDWFQIIGDALGPHTGYVRDVVATRDGRRAWSCAYNFAPRWNASGDGGTYEPTSERETLELFTGDILSLALSERECEGVFVFCGVADGTIRAFDGTGSPPIDMGVVGGTSSTFRGRVAAMCVVDDELSCQWMSRWSRRCARRARSERAENSARRTATRESARCVRARGRSHSRRR